ncbi:MAG: DUF4388 domain-containing protein [Acidobacteriota bacterium]
MALTGELSDLSLAELIEFFCNQRKTGRLKVVYPLGPGYFYLQAGSVVHARIGVLRGIEAVFCALTLPNASFTFSPAFEPPEQTINQPWTSVVLEGLRRMDEGVLASDPFPAEASAPVAEVKTVEPDIVVSKVEEALPEDDESKNAPIDVPVATPAAMPAFLSQVNNESRWGKPWKLGAIGLAVALVLVAIGIPWARNKAARLAAETKASPVTNTETSASAVPTNETPVAPTPDESIIPADNAAQAEQFAKRQREARARERAQENATAALANGPQPEAKATPNTANPNTPKSQPSPVAAGKKVTVQVFYDENGRVTQASGGDATALRIARQKRFPAGKAGSATVTIPIN